MWDFFKTIVAHKKVAYSKYVLNERVSVLAGPVQITQLLVIGNPLYYCLCLILLQVLNSYPVGVE